jgi:uncharacterized protein (DUF934 family)
MPNSIIKNDNGQWAITQDQWQLVAADATEVPTGAVILPLALWQEHKANLQGRDQLGVWLNSDESPQLIADDLKQLNIVAINFPAFADGRGFSYARELNDRHHFTGEIRAIGGFIRDQLFYLKRCGFTTFALENTDQQAALASLNDFSDGYQASIDQPEPLFKRR